MFSSLVCNLLPFCNEIKRLHVCLMGYLNYHFCQRVSEDLQKFWSFILIAKLQAIDHSLSTTH